MARRNALKRLSWCSREQLDSIARSIGFTPDDFPDDADSAARAQQLYEWATSIKGPGLLTLEAAIPWSIEPEISKQFEVQGPASQQAGATVASYSDAAMPRVFPESSTAATLGKPPVTITRVSPATEPTSLQQRVPESPAPEPPPPVTQPPPPAVTAENPSGPTVWETGPFSSASIIPPRTAPAPGILEAGRPHSAPSPDVFDTSRRESPDDLAPRPTSAFRSNRPETPHGLPAYGAAPETAAPESTPPSTEPESGESQKQQPGRWWKNLLGKSGK